MSRRVHQIEEVEPVALRVPQLEQPWVQLQEVLREMAKEAPGEERPGCR
jgi:hypothetical protein